VKYLNVIYLLIKFAIAILVVNTFGNVSQASCLEVIASKYGVPPKVLLSIAIAESGANPHAIGSMNANGTIDMGLMQINSAWLPRLKEFGIKKTDLMKPCVSIEVAAWLISQNINRYGNTWKAIGAYNSGNIKYQALYIKRVADVYHLLEARRDEESYHKSLLGNRPLITSRSIQRIDFECDSSDC